MNQSVPRLVELREYREKDRGALAVAEYPAQIPFVVRRSFHIYDMPESITRGGHAHRTCEQFLICLHGALRLECRFPTGATTFDLTSPRQGLYMPPLTWVDFTALRANSVCLVLTSDPYDPADYINDATEFAVLCTAARGEA